MIGKLFSLVTVGSTIAGVGLLQRFLLAMAVLVMLTIVGSFMFCFLLAGSFYMAHLCLIQYGVDPLIAVMIMTMVALVLTLLCGALAFCKLRQLKEWPHPDLALDKHPWLDIQTLAHSFLQGFLNPNEGKRGR